MALGSGVLNKKLDHLITEVKKYGLVDVIPKQAILSLVGKEMRNMVGIASRMFSVLAHNNINIEMISQGASEINISIVIDETKCKDALVLVHNECILG